MSRYTDAMWQETAPLFGRILAHPFNRELAAGTLARDTFLFYMIQDAHYLGAFARALAVIAAKAPHADGQTKFAKSAHDAIIVERSLHEGFFRDFGVTPELFRATPASPTSAGYANFLLATAYAQPFAVGVAGVLPCFQIYWEVGKELYRIAASDNPYRRWIDTYADDAFGDSVKQVLGHVDRAHAEAAPAERLLMDEAYRMACRYEWLFWDSAWRREAWPA